MGQFHRHLAIVLGAIIVMCCSVVGVRWVKLAGRVTLSDLDMPRSSFAQESREVEDSSTVDPISTSNMTGGNQARDTHGLINLNTATAEELEMLPGIGPVLAQNIVNHRAEHGAFRSVAELDHVKGIGEKKLAGICDQVCIAGKP